MSTLTPRQTADNIFLSNVARQSATQAQQAYGGQLTAGLTPGMAGLQSYLQGMGPGFGGQFDAAAGMATQRALAGKPSYDLDPETTKAYFKQAVYAPMMREYQKSIRPAIKESFAGRGMMFSQAAGQAQQESLENINAQALAEMSRTEMANQQLRASLAESAAARQMQAVPMSQALAMQPMARAQAFGQAVSPYQQYAQQGLDRQYGEFQRQYQAPLGALGPLGQSVGQQHMAGYQEQAAPSPWWGLASAGLGAAAGMAGSYLGNPAAFGGGGGGGGGGVTGNRGPRVGGPASPLDQYRNDLFASGGSLY